MVLMRIHIDQENSVFLPALESDITMSVLRLPEHGTGEAYCSRTFLPSEVVEKTPKKS